MTVAEIKTLIGLLDEANGVFELEVTASDGSSVALKRSPLSHAPAPSTQLVPASGELHGMEMRESIADSEDDNDLEPAIFTIAASIVGVFHQVRPPIVVGDRVSTGQILGSIESMKLMNDVLATARGVVIEAPTSDNRPVEYGQTLFRISLDIV